jgi:hypothetical protein
MKKIGKSILGVALLTGALATNAFAYSVTAYLNYGERIDESETMAIIDVMKVTGKNTGSNPMFASGVQSRWPLWDVEYGEMYLKGGQTRTTTVDVDHSSYYARAEVAYIDPKDGTIAPTTGTSTITNY